MFNGTEKLILGVFVFIYFVFLFGLSLYISRNVKTYEDYNVAGRNVGLFPLILTFVGTAIGGSILLGYITNGYDLGMGQQWMNIGSLFASIIIIIFLASKIRKLGEEYDMVTIGDFTALRFGQAARLPTAICMLVAYCSITGMQFVAIATILKLTLDLNMTIGILIGWLLLTLKTYFGGLEAVIIQDAIHGTIQTIGILVLFIVVWKMSGNWGEMRDYAASIGEAGNLDLFGIAPSEIFVFLLTIGAYQFIRQDVWQRFWAAKDFKTSRNGFMLSIVISIGTGMIAVLIGIMAKYGLKLDIANSALAYYHIIGHIMPFPLVVLLLIVLLATVISTADSFFISASSSIVNDIIKPRVKHNDSKKMLRYSKQSVLIVSVIALLLALYIPKLVTLWILGTAMLVSGLLAPVLFGLYWKKTTAKAGVYTMWIGLSVSAIWQLLDQPFGLHPVFIGLPVSIVLIIVISLFTSSSEKESHA